MSRGAKQKNIVNWRQTCIRDVDTGAHTVMRRLQRSKKEMFFMGNLNREKTY